MAKKTKKDLNKNLVETLSEMEVVKEATKANKKNAPKVSKKIAKAVRDSIEVKFKLLHEDAALPAYAHAGDIGMDVVATEIEYNMEHDYYICHTGLACETEEGVAQFLLARSSVSNVDGYLCNGIGLVDPFTYRGEICFRFKNRLPIGHRIGVHALCVWNSLKWYQRLRYSFNDVYNEVEEQIYDNIMQFAPYKEGDKIGQLVHVRVPEVKVTQVEVLSETERGEGGFGSTGN